MKIIFLDIEGVLLSEASIRLLEYQKRAGEVSSDIEPSREWGPSLTNNLRILLEKTPEDVRIVLSSLWRLGKFSLQDLQALFDHYDVDGSRVVGATPFLPISTRGTEIEAWLKEHRENMGVTEYAILDDDADMGKHLDHLVQTDPRVGLTLSNVDQVLDKLGGQCNADAPPNNGSE